jgi:hypothetical protein
MLEPVTKKALAEAAAFSQRSPRTLRRWESLGCNLADRESLEDFMARSMQRSRGNATRQIARAQRPVAAAGTNHTKVTASLNGENGQDGQLGALGALARLRNLEQTFYVRLKELLKTLKPDRPDLVSSLLGDYTRTSDTLRRYEHALQLEQRDLVDFIPKREAIESLEAALRWMRLGIRRWESSCLPELLTFKDPLSAKVYFEKSFVEIVTLTVKNAMVAALPVPQWGLEAIQKEWRLD